MKALTVSILVSLCWWSCSEPSKPEIRKVSAEDLIAFNQAKFRAQAALIADSTSTWGEDSRTLRTIRWRWIDKGGEERPARHVDGTVVSWAADVSLTDGSVRMSATATKPLMMAIGLTDLPASFHDLAAMTIPGDSVEAWIPAAEAWGLSGKPPVIPQDAVIHLRFKVLSVQTPEST
jgi:hypothetical protein